LILNYKRYGTDGPHVVIVHGLFGMLDNWHNIANKLSDRFSVISVDVRNHGGSGHDMRMGYDDICNDIKALLTELKIPSAHFIGHSMGGKAVMKMADLYPDIIDKLCIVDIAPKRYKPGHQLIFDAMFNLPVQDLKSRSEAEQQLASSIKELGIRLFILKNLERKPEGGYGWKLGLDEIYQNYPVIIGAIELAWPFSNPTLFITGENSNYVNEDDESDILNFFPNAKFKAIKNSGHWVHAENPTDFLQAVESFLA
jgi:esterase